MASIYDDYFRSYDPRMTPAQANSAHDYHIIEFEEMCKQMIASALAQHDEQLQVDVQTTLNGRSCTMSGLISDIKKQIMDKLRKAFR